MLGISYSFLFYVLSQEESGGSKKLSNLLSKPTDNIYNKTNDKVFPQPPKYVK